MNYFKKFLQIIFKFLIYKIALERYKVYQKKNILTQVKLSSQIDFIKEYKSVYILIEDIKKKIIIGFNNLKHFIIFRPEIF